MVIDFIVVFVVVFIFATIFVCPDAVFIHFIVFYVTFDVEILIVDNVKIFH